MQQNRYDALGQRIKRKVYSGGSFLHDVDYYYDDQWQLLEERKNDNPNPLNQYVWHPYYVDALAARYYDADVDGEVDEGEGAYYCLHDANYNVVALLDLSGAAADSYHYAPYGQLRRASPVNAHGNTHFYTGRELDWETGLQINRHRHYAPHLGRWASRDLIEYEDSYNLYLYVHDSPLVLTDPLGLGCKVCYNCIVVSETGRWRKRCEYRCVEDPDVERHHTAQSGCDCEDPRIPTTITWGKTQFGSCKPTFNTCQIFVDNVVDLRDCSRSQCRKDMATTLRALKQTCRLIPEPAARRACQATYEAIKAAMEEACNSCKNP